MNPRANKAHLGVFERNIIRKNNGPMCDNIDIDIV